MQNKPDKEEDEDDNNNGQPQTYFGEIPPNYVPGASRGATGFTTTAEYVTANDLIDPEDNRGLLAIFNSKEDDEADEVWDHVSEKMSERRKRQREEKEKEKLEEYRKKRPKIQASFSDITEELKKMDPSDWYNIPEQVDRTQKKRHHVKYTPVPDSILLDAVSKEKNSSLSSSKNVALNRLKVKESVIKSHISRIEDSVTGQTTVDPALYQAGLDSMITMKDADITDLKRARVMLASLTLTNPQSASGWIARARVEELAGKKSAAKKFIRMGCQNCKKDKNVWIEAVRLHKGELDICRALLGEAVEHLPNCEEIWIKAAEVEKGVKAKRKILQKALEVNPKSLALWKEAIELEDENGAKILLSNAVKNIHDNVDLWLALARLETYENAKKVLNRARKKNPTEPIIWVSAAQLEEVNGNSKLCDVIIKKCVLSLKKQKLSINREQWFQFAYDCEDGKHFETERAIIRYAFSHGFDKDDLYEQFIKDSERAIRAGKNETAFLILSRGAELFPEKKRFWKKLYQLETSSEKRGKRILEVLNQAVKNCTKSEELWLLYIRELFFNDQIENAKKVLYDSFKYHKNSEEIWLALVEIETRSGNAEKAREALKNALKLADTGRVRMKYLVFERNMGGDKKVVEKLLKDGLRKFPNYPKLWMIRGQVFEEEGKNDQALASYRHGLKFCANSIPLWCCCVILETNRKRFASARALLSQARGLNSHNSKLWYVSVQVEQLSGSSVNEVKQVLAQGLQECPQSGMLWGLSIDLEDRAKQVARIKLALDKLEEESPFVLIAMAKKFWKENKIEAARKYLNRAVKLDKELGDTWCYLYKFEKQHGDKAKQENVKTLCNQIKPYKGDIWCHIKKKKENYKCTIETLLEIGAGMINVYNETIILSSYEYKKD